MKQPLHNIINELNESSQIILSEIERPEPAFETIKNALNKREDLVKKMGAVSEATPKESMTDEERISLKYLFNTFVELNDNIQSNLQQVLNSHKEKLDTAVDQRKVEKSYTVLKNPDISYF